MFINMFKMLESENRLAKLGVNAIRSNLNIYDVRLN